MGGGSFEALPDAIARAARVASVPAELRALFEHLPERIVLDVELPADATLATTELQLLKLASLGGALEGGALRRGERARFVLASGDRRHDVSADDLGEGIATVCRRALEALLAPAAFTRALEAFAGRAARLAALQTLTRQMLLTEDLDQALGAMLAGITSGSALAFNRAALFVRDETTGAFVGTKAVGPFDEQEAHRIWEAIEYEDKSFEEQLRDSVRARVDARLEAFVRQLALVPVAADGDEVTSALAGTRPALFTRARVSPALAQLGSAPEIVLAPIAPRGDVRALLYADNAYDRAPVDRERLEVLGYFIDEVALVWDNLALLRKVEQLARFDELTGLYNRRGFDERFREEQSRCARTRERCALLLCDLDHFKAINDTRGHDGGDAVLRKVGDILRGGVRELDTAARHGGDEFVVLLAGASRDEAIAVATRIGAAATRYGISLSIGGAAWPDDCAEPAKLLSAADARLYEAKRWRGRACFGGGVVLEL